MTKQTKLTAAQINEINRKIAAGTYIHEADEDEMQIEEPKIEKKPRGRPRKVTEDE